MPKALANRFIHFDTSTNFDNWKKWALRNNIHPMVIGFLSFRPDYLNTFDTSNENLAFATPRSWEMVSNLLHATGGDAQKIYPMIAGCVGTGIAVEFCAYCKVYASLPSMKDVFDGKYAVMPKSPDALYALISSMTAYAKEHKNELSRIGNSIVFAKQMPPDFSAVLLKNYMAIEKGYKEKLMALPDFAAWLRTKGSLLNGTV